MIMASIAIIPVARKQIMIVELTLFFSSLVNDVGLFGELYGTAEFREEYELIQPDIFRGLQLRNLPPPTRERTQAGLRRAARI